MITEVHPSTHAPSRHARSPSGLRLERALSAGLAVLTASLLVLLHRVDLPLEADPSVAVLTALGAVAFVVWGLRGATDDPEAEG